MLSPEIGGILAGNRAHGWVLEPDAKRILQLRGIAVPRHILAARLEDALRFASAAGYPVVAKVVSPEILHKSDVGGVRTNIGDEEALAAAFDRLQGLQGAQGVLVEEACAGVELIVGAKRDDQFGPVLLVGFGGVRAELYRDRALRLVPLGEGDAEDMIASLRGAPLLNGYRGSAPVDRAALVALLQRFSELVLDLGGEMTSADLNPVFCFPGGCVAADARILLAGS